MRTRIILLLLVFCLAWFGIACSETEETTLSVQELTPEPTIWSFLHLISQT